MSNPISTIVLNSIVESGSRTLEAREPTKAMLCLELLADGSTWQQVADETGWSFTQIGAVKARHEVAIEVH